jgi:hypothetical protein
MRCTILAVSFILVSSLTVPAQRAFNQGDSYVFQFDALPEGALVLGPHFQGGRFSLALNAASIQSGDTLLMEMFEEEAVGPAGAAMTLDLATGFPQLVSPEMWADHDGAIRITAISGGFTLDQIVVQRGDPTNPPDPIGVRHQLNSLTVVPVPEPSTLALLAMGLIAGVWASRKAKGL